MCGLSVSRPRTPFMWTLQVLASQDAAGGPPAAAGVSPEAAGNASATFRTGALEVGTLWDVHMVAVDLSDNTQPNVTSLM